MRGGDIWTGLQSVRDTETTAVQSLTREHFRIKSEQHIFGLWEETHTAWREHINSTHKGGEAGLRPCCEVTSLTTS